MKRVVESAAKYVQPNRRLVKLLSIVTLLFTITASAFAEPPRLEINPNDTKIVEVTPGQVLTYHVTYTQPAGDPPKTLHMVVEPPTGDPITVQPAQSADTDAAKGIHLTWTYTPANTGKYKYYFEATSTTGDKARLPQVETEEFEFVSSNIAIKYIILAIGLIVALGFVPFVVYAATRSINKKSDPSAAARIAILIGILASYALFIYLFFNFYQWLGVGIGAVAALAIIVAIFTRRR